MKTEEEIRTAIKQILKHYHKELKNHRRNLPEWIATTYFLDALSWVVGDIKDLPPILSGKSSIPPKQVRGKNQHG